MADTVPAGVWDNAFFGQGEGPDELSVGETPQSTTDFLYKDTGHAPAIEDDEVTRGREERGDDFARRKLRDLTNATSRDFNRLFEALTRACSPDDVLSAALHLFAETGRVVFVQTAASLMESFGADAWVALRQLSESGNPQCFWFVSAIAACPGVAERFRSAALCDLAINIDRDVRLRVVSTLDELSPASRKRILGILSRDIDGEIREEATNALAGAVL